MRPKTPFGKLCEDILFGLEFDKRYYEHLKNHPKSPGPISTPYVEEAKATLLESGFTPRYIRREKFFECMVRHGEYTFHFDVCFSGSFLEMTLYAQKARDLGGGVFHGLAKDLGTRRDSNFAPNPPYPRIPYADVAQMNEAIRFGVSLFRDFERTLLDQVSRSG